ncbi:nucleoside 2-deoxyribosyltransferase [Aeromonas phage BUCT695]|uniref:nucleoside 2-deoxyribosyltransferase n=1 Tax=Aeromonas phage BUCT695 TaxID=2908630 RepID=UPI002329583A|nr:nucleoside 2-deoxyribosyltransferase [Aeromonas phage BUCT695]UIW10574.1 nucleoside 2-deoxyribosyltransferase [Aeromonas phage BUCT695]
MKIYLGGHCLTRGSQYQRKMEKADIDAVRNGVEWYNPQDNKEINDKANLDNNEGLAEKIVRHDTDAIFWSDTVVIEPLPEALGTHVELGQIKGMRDVANKALDIIARSEGDHTAAIAEIIQMCEKQVNRKVYPHYEDIRRFKGVNESEDRRSLGINQYVYGVCLELSDGKGFYEWSEVLDDIKNRNDF